jgi:hypothetical protein
MLDRRGHNGLAVERGRRAVNAARYRRRYNAGQSVLMITAVPERARNFLVRRGYLQPGEHTNAAIESALSLLIDDEGQ